MFENDVYLYGLKHKDDIPIPIRKLEIGEVSQKTPQEIIIGSERFYYECTQTLSKKGNYILIGNNIRFDFDQGKLTYKSSGSLKERIKDLQLSIVFFLT